MKYRDFLFVAEWVAIGKTRFGSICKNCMANKHAPGPHYAKVLEKFNATTTKQKWLEKFVTTPYQFETFIARNKDHGLIFSSSAAQPKF